MAPDAARLMALADAVAEGKAVDWAEAESTSVTHEDRELVAQLRLLAGVADVHRAVSQPAADERVGTKWGPLLIKERIGGGTFGAVYRAHDPRLALDVALKLLHYDADREKASEAVEEGRLLARVRHPNVITVYGADRHQGTVGVWMELISGRTLEEFLRTDGAFGAREAALIGIDLCSALAAVHAQGLVHRDVKAQNVMRGDGGRIVLMDFGAGQEARLNADHTSVGTPAYMAPEVLAGHPATVQTDLFSLGVLLFRLVTGQYPVDARTASTIGRAHVAGRVRRLRDLRPTLPSAFVQAVERAIAQEPQDRFESAGAMQRVLEATLVEAPAAIAIRPATRFRWYVAAIAITAMGVSAGALWPRLKGLVSPNAQRVIAVRPLKNLDGTDVQRYFASGLTEVLLANLGAVKALRVVALPDPAPSAEEMARLGDAAILEGSVQRDAGRIRVSARLVHASSGSLLWGRVYEGAETDAFGLQARIASDLVRDLGVPVTAVESGRLARKYISNQEAQDAYLRGRYLLDMGTRAGLTEARALLEKAVRLEPQYAQAWASLSRAYLALGNFGVMTPAEVRQVAPPAADAAISADPTLAEAALAVADVRFRLQRDWSAADEAYRHALELNPSSTDARGQYARFLAASGRTADAMRVALDAYETDPLSIDLHSVVGMMLYYDRQFDRAIAHFRSRLQEPSPRSHFGLGRAASAAGRHEEAIPALRRALEISGGDPSFKAELGRALAAAGDVGGARAVLQDLEGRRQANREYIAPHDLAYVYIALAQPDTAFDLMNQALDEQASRLLFLAVDPRMDPVRGDPRFTALIDRLKNNGS